MHAQPPDAATADAYLRGVAGAICPDGRCMERVQHDTLYAVTRALWGYDVDPADVEPMPPEELAARVTDPERRRGLVQLMVTLELLLHPVPAEVSDRVGEYADALEVHEPSVRQARLLARDQAMLMYMCIQRNSWYPAETRRELRQGRLFELLRSKLAYYAVARDDRIAGRWRALGDLPEGTWGRGVFDFYGRNGFPFPGERHGIYEVGAMHDWVHVLTDYGTTPEGEIDVFAFIAAAMPDPQGFILLVVTLGIFQNGSVRHMFGRKVPAACVDAMDAPGAPLRFADALRRGTLCGVDVLGGVDHFALAAEPLDAVRERFNVVPPQG
jgi:hypothetical protein